MSARPWFTPNRSNRIRSNQLESLRDLVNDLNAGQVEFLVILGGEPCVRRACGFRFCRRAAESDDCAFIPVFISDETCRALPLACPGRALAGILERCSRVRRHRRHRSAADRAAVRRPFGARNYRACLPVTAGSPATIWFATTGRASALRKTRRSKRSGKRLCTMDWLPARRCLRFPLRRMRIS